MLPPSAAILAVGTTKTQSGHSVLRTLDPGAPIAQSIVDAYAECLRCWGAADAGILIEDSGISHHVARRDLARPGDGAAAAVFRRRIRMRTDPYRVVVLPLLYRAHWTLCVLVLVDPERHPAVPVHLLWADSADDSGFGGLPPGVPEYAAVVAGHHNVRCHNIHSPQQVPGDNNCALHVLRNMEYLVGPRPTGDPGPDWYAPHRIDLRTALEPYATADIGALRGSLRGMLTHVLTTGHGNWPTVLRGYRNPLLLPGRGGSERQRK